MKDKQTNVLWGHLHWLTVLAQQGSYTAAAARLGVSKAAMSQRIAELERAVGVQLVQRTTRSVRLTEAGQHLVDDTQPSFERIAQTFAQAHELAGLPRGLLRVTAPTSFTRQQLLPRLAGFLRDNPEIRLELDLSDRLSSLASEGFDLAIRHTASPPDTHVAWSLCTTHSVLVTTRRYLRSHGVPEVPEDLIKHNCLHYPRWPETPAWTLEPVGRKQVNGHFAERVTIPVSGSLSANNSEALRGAALAGLGIALLPDFSAQRGLELGKLVRVLPQWKPVGSFAEKIYAIRPYTAQVPHAVTALVSYLRRSFASGFGVGTDSSLEFVG